MKFAYKNLDVMKKAQRSRLKAESSRLKAKN